jgi:hypothetical protein
LSFIFGDPNKASKKEAKRIREQEEERQRRIDAGMSGIESAFSGFDDNFFNQRASAFSDFATPQLQDQFSDARENLIFALSRGGKLDSSTAAEKFGDLNQRLTEGQQDIANKGLDFANTARSGVEDARAGIVSQLFATEDADSAVSAALNRSKALTAPPAFSSLGNYFQNISAGLASSLGGAGNQFMGLVGRAPTSFLNFAPGNTRERVV